MRRDVKGMLLVGLGVVLVLGLAGLAWGQDADGDGVLDGDDLCPGTPPDHLVDPCGCTVHTFTWIGGTSGTLDWTDPGNWDPCNVPDTGANDSGPHEYVLIDHNITALTDNRTIIADAIFDPCALQPKAFTWFTDGSHVDKIELATDFLPGGGPGGYNPIYPRFLGNSSGDETKMVLDLAGHKMQPAVWLYAMPAMTIMDSVGGSELTFDAIDIRETNFTVAPEVTLRVKSWLRAEGVTLPNLTVYEDATCMNCTDATISGDVTIEDGGFNANVGRLTIGGDVTVAAGNPNAGLSAVGGVTTGFTLHGDLIDTNTENDNGSGGLLHYRPGKLWFGGSEEPNGVQILNVHRESHMRLIFEPDAHVVLGHDYYAPHVSVVSHESLMQEWGCTLDVGPYDLTLTDFHAKWTGDAAGAPTFIYTAGADSGSIRVLGDYVNNETDTGLRIEKFNVVIRDGGGWNHGDDFILFDYGYGQGWRVWTLPDPQLLSLTVPPDWTHDGLRHDLVNGDPNEGVIYIKGLREITCRDRTLPQGDVNKDCYVDPCDLALMAEQWLDCVDPCNAECMKLQPSPEELYPDIWYMPYCGPGGRTVDGLLTDWTDPCWIRLDVIYDGEPCAPNGDILSAKYTVCWDPCDDMFYAAAVVEDTDQVFETAPLAWNSSDRIEVYVQADPNGGDEWGNSKSQYYDKAQQYVLGYQGLLNWTWAVFGGGQYIPGDIEPGDADFEDAGGKSGTTLTYELGAKAWLGYGGRQVPPGPSEVRQLEPGAHVGFDLIADTRWGPAPHDDADEWGMLSANSMTQKFIFAEKFQRWELMGYDGLILPPECGDWGLLIADINPERDCYVDLRDFFYVATTWMDCTDEDPPCNFLLP